MYSKEKTLIEKELINDENVLWSGRPKGAKSNVDDMLRTAFGLLGILVLFVMILPVLIAEGISPKLILFSPFAIAYLNFAFGKNVTKSYMLKRTYYYVTDKRIIVIRDFKNRRLNSAFIGMLDSIEVKHDRSRGYDVIFGDRESGQLTRPDSGLEYTVNIGESPYPGLGFFNIDDGNEAAKIVRNLKYSNEESEEIN
ncbi:MAG: hypothetical protein N4A40_03330 [Tissierellales bacterium]|jgi:hypothetical protein|nr:hypothetical protein [Tissierellales bacterium]